MATFDLFFTWDGLVNIWLDDEGRADEVQKAKDDQLSKQKEGKGHWEEGLASDSESIVRHSHAFGRTHTKRN